MSFNDEEFFKTNIVNVNNKIAIFLWSSLLVPIFFFIFNQTGIFEINKTLIVILFVTSLLGAVIHTLLNKPSNTLQYIRMYYGILSTAIFIDTVSYSSNIAISVTFCLAPFLSCIYYNRHLTWATTIFTYLTMFAVFYNRGKTSIDVIYGIRTIQRYMTIHMINITMEFIFVFFISDAICSRSAKTLQRLMQTNSDYNSSLSMIKDRNQYIVKMNTDLEHTNKNLKDTQFKIIKFIAQVLGSHDLFTGRHVIHTQKYVELICKELRDMGFYVEELTDENINLFQTAALLHDIGKIHIPEGVLNKIGKFTKEEFELMKCHPVEGEKLLNYLPQVEDGKLNRIAKQMALCHHEKWDGTGYPNGISGEDIPLCARIMAAADVLDALISQRLYKDPMSIEEASEVFVKSKGQHFEPIIADAVINCKHMIEMIDRNFKTSEAESNSKELEWWRNYHETLKKLNM